MMILHDRPPFIQRHDCLLMLDGQLFHFAARKSQNAKEIVFKIDTPVCIIAKTALLWPRSSLDDKQSGITRDR